LLEFVWFQDNRNPRLRENVLMGVISAERLAEMTTIEMASDEMKGLRDKLTKEAINDHQMSTQGGTKSEFFKCGRCGMRDTTYNQVRNSLLPVFVVGFVFVVGLGQDLTQSVGSALAS
jgi:transcription elongation factor S-II